MKTGNTSTVDNKIVGLLSTVKVWVRLARKDREGPPPLSGVRLPRFLGHGLRGNCTDRTDNFFFLLSVLVRAVSVSSVSSFILIGQVAGPARGTRCLVPPACCS